MFIWFNTIRIKLRHAMYIIVIIVFVVVTTFSIENYLYSIIFRNVVNVLRG